jgi:hypothetical protein
VNLLKVRVLPKTEPEPSAKKEIGQISISPTRSTAASETNRCVDKIQSAFCDLQFAIDPFRPAEPRPIVPVSSPRPRRSSPPLKKIQIPPRQHRPPPRAFASLRYSLHSAYSACSAVTHQNSLISHFSHISFQPRLKLEPKPNRNRTTFQTNLFRRLKNGAKADQNRTKTGSKVEKLSQTIANPPRSKSKNPNSSEPTEPAKPPNEISASMHPCLSIAPAALPLDLALDSVRLKLMVKIVSGADLPLSPGPRIRAVINHRF